MMSAGLLCRWTISLYDDDDDDKYVTLYHKGQSAEEVDLRKANKKQCVQSRVPVPVLLSLALKLPRSSQSELQSPLG